MRLRLLAARCAAALTLLGTAAMAFGAPILLPQGTLITALQDGQASVLGADTGFAPGAGSNVTALSDTDLEFLTADTLVGIDLFSSGLVQLYDNGGTGLSGSTVLQLDFGALLFEGVSVDLSSLLGGSINATRINPHTLQLTLTDLQLDGSFGPLNLQLQQAQSLPEPAPLALLAAAALALALSRRAATRRG